MSRATLHQESTLHTNSIIHISSDVSLSKLNLTWRRLSTNGSLPYLISRCRNFQPGEYYCSPLDWNCMISVSIKYGNFQQNLTYGPIKLQQELIKKWLKKNQHQKNNSRPNSYKATLCCENFQQIKVSTSLFNHHLRKQTILIQNSQNCTLLPKHILCSARQYTSLQVLKIVGPEKIELFVGTIKVKTLKNGYMPIEFESRFERDLFICEIMELNGIPITSNIHENSKLDHSITFTEECQKEHQNYGFTLRSRVINMEGFESEIDALIDSSSETQQNQELIQELFPVLYTPSASSNIAHNLKQFKKKSAKNQSLEKDSDLMKTVKHSDKMNSNSQNGQFSFKEVVHRHKKGKSKFSTHVPEAYSHRHLKSEMNLQTFNFQEQKIRNINYKIEDQIDSVLSKKNHIFGYVNPNSNIEDKISHLINTNILLFDQNKKLTNENSCLKIHKGKNIVPPNRKIHKLKTTLNNISARISFLEGFHAAKKQQNQKNQRKSQDEIRRSRKQTQITQSQENFKEIGKNHKYKNSFATKISRQEINSQNKGKNIFIPRFIKQKSEISRKKSNLKFNSAQKEVFSFGRR